MKRNEKKQTEAKINFKKQFNKTERNKKKQ